MCVPRGDNTGSVNREDGDVALVVLAVVEEVVVGEDVVAEEEEIIGTGVKTCSLVLRALR